MISRIRLGVGCALAAASIYGLVPNFVRGAFENGIPPVEATFFRTSVLAVAFALIAVVQGESFRIPRAAMAAFAGQAIATLVISVSYLASVQFIPIGLAVIIFFTFPVLIMLASPVVEGKFPGFWRIIIAIFAFGGLVVAIGPSFSDLDIRGIGLATLASLARRGAVFLRAFHLALSHARRVRQPGAYRHLAGNPAGCALCGRRNPANDAWRGRHGNGVLFPSGRGRRLCRGLYAANVFPALCARFNRSALLQSGADCHHGFCRACCLASA